MTEIPLRNRRGDVVAHALIDDIDAQQAEFRWRRNNYGYAVRSIRLPDGRRPSLLLHREILGLRPGDGLEGDHKNRNRLDCRRENLRITTHAQNHQNRGAGSGASRFRGVTYDGSGHWVAQAKLNGRRYYLGYFACEEEAAQVARAFREAHMPYTIETAA